VVGNAASQQKPVTVATTAGLLLTVTVLDVAESSDYQTGAGGSVAQVSLPNPSQLSTFPLTRRCGSRPR
jgi:hypothetical protein